MYFFTWMLQMLTLLRHLHLPFPLYICVFFPPELFESALQTWCPYTPNFSSIKAKAVLFYISVFCNLESFSVFLLFPDTDILKNTASCFVEWPSTWMFVFLCLEVAQWNIFLSIYHTWGHWWQYSPLLEILTLITRLMWHLPVSSFWLICILWECTLKICDCQELWKVLQTNRLGMAAAEDRLR